MQIHLTEKEMQSRVYFVEERLRTIENALSLEMNKPFYHRIPNTVKFLHTEKKIYATLLKELKYILNA